MTFEDHCAIVLKANPALAENPFLRPLAESAWIGATKAEREACAEECDRLTIALKEMTMQRPVAWRRATKYGWEFRASEPTAKTREREQGWMPLYDGQPPELEQVAYMTKRGAVYG